MKSKAKPHKVELCNSEGQWVTWKRYTSKAASVQAFKAVRRQPHFAGVQFRLA